MPSSSFELDVVLSVAQNYRKSWGDSI